MKIADNTEWSIQDDKIMIVKPSNEKVYSGNKSVLLTFNEILANQPNNIDELTKLVLEELLESGTSLQVDNIKKDVMDIVDYFVSEGIVIF